MSAAKAATGRLPGMDEPEIKDLEEKAHEYLKIRNKRQDLTRREVELKTDLLGLMKKHKKKEYVRDGIEIRVVVEEETVKVKIHDEEPEEEETEK
jgi:hypothetical protein